jgi:hypothetical protein
MNQDDEEPRMRAFAVMWDCNGLESIGEIVDPAMKSWAILGNTPVPREDFNLEHWKLRARFNSQRHYEIYAIGVDGTLVAYFGFGGALNVGVLPLSRFLGGPASGAIFT